MADLLGAFRDVAQGARGGTGLFGSVNFQQNRGEGSYLQQQYPGILGALKGFLGTAPDEVGGSVLDGSHQAMSRGADIGFPWGTIAQLLPLAKFTKGLPIGASIKDVGEKFVYPQEEALATAQQKMAAATLWHGSPHKFDKFDSSKIGTGEGAQAYGHGLYLSESPGVAKGYIPSLSNEDAAKIILDEITKNGRGTYGLRVPPDPVNVGDVLSPSMRWVDGDMTDKSLRGVSVAAIKNNDVLSALQNLGISKRGPNGHYFGDEVALVKGSSAKVGQDFGEWTLKDAKVVGKYLKKGNSTDPILGGALYKVALPDEHIAKMLDLDKPFSQQHPDVQKALNGIVESEYTPNLAQITNPLNKNPLSHSLGTLNDQLGGQNVTSTYLQQAGIPGIRYLDGGSRGTGQGTSNFVVFPGNENLLQILERNGQGIK